MQKSNCVCLKKYRSWEWGHLPITPPHRRLRWEDHLGHIRPCLKMQNKKWVQQLATAGWAQLRYSEQRESHTQEDKTPLGTRPHCTSCLALQQCSEGDSLLAPFQDWAWIISFSPVLPSKVAFKQRADESRSVGRPMGRKDREKATPTKWQI